MYQTKVNVGHSTVPISMAKETSTDTGRYGCQRKLLVEGLDTFNKNIDCIVQPKRSRELWLEFAPEGNAFNGAKNCENGPGLLLLLGSHVSMQQSISFFIATASVVMDAGDKPDYQRLEE